MTLLRYSLRNIAATRIRFALTALAVVIGVALTVGVLINTDGLRSAFSDLAGDLYDQVDLSVRAQSTLGNADQWQDLRLLDPSLKDRLEAIDGVERTAGAVSEFNVVAVGADGEAIDPQLSQQGGMGWPEDESLGRIFPLDDGVSRRPAGPDEFAMDQHTAAEFGFRVGERYRVATPTGTHRFELVGVFYFMAPDFQAPFQLVAWEMDTAREVLHDGGGYDLIDVRLSPGASLDEVAASIERELGPAYTVLSQQEQVEARDQELSDLLDVFRNALLAFAVIVLVISAFITYNTFTLVTGQRIKEFGLLRVLGADRRQVALTVAFEALVMGVVAAVVGFGLGIGVSEALNGILSAAGSNLPPTELVVGAGPIIAALALGVGLTVVVSLWPAMRARRVTPIVALADDADIDAYSRRRSVVVGSAVGAVGLVLMVVGLLSDLSSSGALILLLGFGALGMLVGVNICSPAVAGPMSQVLGWPAARLFRLNGRLARLNAARNPRRTATTASALMIGLAMVSLVTVLGTSFKETLNGQLEDSVRADWMLCAGPCDNQQLAFSSEAAAAAAQVPELESVEVFRFRPDGVRTADGAQHVLSAANLASFSSHVEPNVTSGSVAGAGPGDVMVHVDAAEELGLAVGDEVLLEISGHEEVAFEVVALHTEDSVVGSWVIDLDDWDRYVVGDQDSLVTAVTAAGVGSEDARAALEAALDEYPQVVVRDQAEYRASRTTQVDNLLVVVNVFLIMALVIAVMGFSNTMALSVFERTREIGLLRAVGMGKRQIRAAILLEGVIVAVFGGVIGVVTGLVAGSIAAGSLPSGIISTVALPGGTVVVYLVVAAVAGLLASLAPARRANRIDLLEAISYH